MTRSYQLSDQSVKKLSKFLANPKYQPPKRRRESEEAVSSQSIESTVIYARLQEDAATTRKEIYAFELQDDGSLGSEYIQIYDRFNWLAVARASQDVMAVWDAAKSRWAYVPGSCITFNSANNQAAAINSTYTPSGGEPQDAPDGVVGSSYSHTLSTSFINTPTVTGLPPGLSSSWSPLVISGTPTTAGTYYVKIVATATGSGVTGTRTRIVKIVVTE